MAVPFPILHTKRLRLREIIASDLERIYYFRSDPEIAKYIKREPQTLETAEAHIKKITAEARAAKSISWGITSNDSEVLIGSICLWNFSDDKKTAEVGYDLDTKFQGWGLMSEALKAVLDYGFGNCGFKTIEAYTDYRNIPSINLLKRHGFIPNANKHDADNQNNSVFYLNR